MRTEDLVKIGGYTLTVLGFVLNVTTGILDDKKLELKIAKEVSKQIHKK